VNIPTTTSPLDALENQYFLLRGSLSPLIGKGATADQVAALQDQIAQSRSNYFAAVQGTLDADDEAVQSLVTQLNTEQLTLAATVDHMDDVAKVLNEITKAVQIGSELAAKVTALAAVI